MPATFIAAVILGLQPPATVQSFHEIARIEAPAAVLGGSGGDAYFLFQQRPGTVSSLTPDEGGWLVLTGMPRFDILPIVHDGYHDIRVDVTGCFKWSCHGYAPHDVDDYHKLSPQWFDNGSMRRNSTRPICSGSSAMADRSIRSSSRNGFRVRRPGAATKNLTMPSST